MPRVISSSKLRSELSNVLNEVAFGADHYIVERSGQPTVAIVSMEDLALLHKVKDEQTRAGFRRMLDELRARTDDPDAAELDRLVDLAREEFHKLRRT
jgi:prevent-host-death family protein